ncbi:DUF6160 family protein [Bermanella sp. R86510]|uniref:DUF6160 family protein n=1 Tax=unclassified Bermanella TaxID=2627862 RepID=UPI0037CB0B5E
MKGLKKLALATAVAAAPFAHADLVAMDDSALGQMTGQAGITIDVDLQMTIDAIKYVDSDGNTLSSDGTAAEQGAITMKSVQMGQIDATGALTGAAQIRGVTIDADGNDGLVIGLTEIGTGATVAGSVNQAEGIDISVGAVIIGNGNAEKTVATYAQTEASDPTFGGDAEAWYLANVSSDTTEAAAFAAAPDAATRQTIVQATTGKGNIGGVVIQDFTNFVSDNFVATYDDRFDMALQTVTGNFVRGEIVINGTGNAGAGTSGLSIEAKMGGIMSKMAWVDDGGQFGVKDMAFFDGVDVDLDGIHETIEPLKFSVDIDVVERASSVAATNLVDGSALNSGDTVAQLQLSNMSIKGSIIMGDIFVGNSDSSVQTSLGSVLVKDIDMTGTNVWVYGH